MLFCKTCQVDYEGEMRFCPKCGHFLVRKETFSADSSGSEPPSEEKPKEKYICPDCKIIYEKSKSCIRCGGELILLSAFQSDKKNETVQEPVREKESSQALTTQEWLESTPEPLICPACKKEHLGGKVCIRCGTALVSHDSLSKEKKTVHRPIAGKKSETRESPGSPAPELETDLVGDEPSEPQPPKLSVQEQIKQGRLARKIKKDYPRTALNWSGMAIIGIAVAYFLWSAYTHIAAEKPVPPDPSPSVETASLPVPASSPIPPSAEAVSETGEIEKIRNLLENIRRANLAKDITLFISCYAKDFQDREGKKKAALQSWERFNFLDLTYHLEARSMSADTVRARVEWLTRFAPKSGGPSQESKTTLDVVFKKEGGDWKIAEILSSL